MSGLPTTAEAFQAAGITVLLYDTRGVGLSDGLPRNDIDPFRQIDDMSDALTFLSAHLCVDPRKGVGLWGISLSASVAMVTAALDTRICFVIAVCPATEPRHNITKFAPVLAKAVKDRESRIKGNEPFYVPMLTKAGESPTGFELGFEREAVTRLLRLHDGGSLLHASLAPNHVNRTTVATYRKMLLWEPRHMWQYLKQPVLFLISELDQFISTDVQLRHFESLSGPKRLHIQKGATHMNILDGANQKDVNELQVEFICDTLDGKIVKP